MRLGLALFGSPDLAVAATGPFLQTLCSDMPLPDGEWEWRELECPGGFPPTLTVDGVELPSPDQADGVQGRLRGPGGDMVVYQVRWDADQRLAVLAWHTDSPVYAELA